MLTASARALWPFSVRFSAPSPAWIARAPARRTISGSICPSLLCRKYINQYWAPPMFCPNPALGSVESWAAGFRRVVGSKLRADGVKLGTPQTAVVAGQYSVSTL